MKEGYEVLHFRVGLGYDPLMMNTNDFLTIAKNVTTSRLVKAGPFGPASTVTEMKMMGYSWGGGQASHLIASMRASTDPTISKLPVHLALIDAVALGDAAFIAGPAVSQRPDVQSLFNLFQRQGNTTLGSFVLQATRNAVMADMAAVLAGASFVGTNHRIPSSLFRNIAVNEMRALLDQIVSFVTKGNPAHGVGFSHPGDDEREVIWFNPKKQELGRVSHISIDDTRALDPLNNNISVTDAAIAFLKSKAQ
jgi:hypothetical protein